MDTRLEALEARVNDLEECLAEICERIAFWRDCRDRTRRPPSADNIADLLNDLAETIKAHPLNA
jgi:hypothetical protein